VDSIFLLDAFLAADSSIPRALDHPIMIIVGMTLYLRVVERLDLHALHHLRHGFLILIDKLDHLSRANLGWCIRPRLYDLGFLHLHLLLLLVVVGLSRL